MLDLFISYINFLILAFCYIVKKFAFLPPNPPKYEIIKEKIKKGKKIVEREDILFLIKTEKDKVLKYRQLKPKFLNINFSRIIKDDISLPILKISPVKYRHLCIIYCQGNSGDLGTSLFECFDIAILCKCLIITFEYPGFGICKNDEIKESEFFKRMKILYNYITKNLYFKPYQIILYGFSLGSGIAFDFACRKEFPVAGLILQSPFLSILRTIYNIKSTKYFDLFNNCDKAKNLCTQTLIIHGNQDNIVPYVHGRILAKLIPEKYFYDFLTVNNADHNNLLRANKPLLFKYINEFISFCTEDKGISKNLSRKNKLYNIDANVNEEKDKSISNLVSLAVSENSALNLEDQTKKTNLFSENEKNLENSLKANSYASYPIRKTIKLSNISQNNSENPNMRYSLQIKKDNNEKKNANYLEKIKQKLTNITKAYYYVNIGTYSKNNKFSIYNNYCKAKNSNINNKSTSIENSMASMYSSTNNITNST